MIECVDLRPQTAGQMPLHELVGTPVWVGGRRRRGVARAPAGAPAGAAAGATAGTGDDVAASAAAGTVDGATARAAAGTVDGAAANTTPDAAGSTAGSTEAPSTETMGGATEMADPAPSADLRAVRREQVAQRPRVRPEHMTASAESTGIVSTGITHALLGISAPPNEPTRQWNPVHRPTSKVSGKRKRCESVEAVDGPVDRTSAARSDSVYTHLTARPCFVRLDGSSLYAAHSD
jgi:hypothetical protein